MIIRSNLASAPIKNYSLFLLGCVLLGIAVVGFTAWNLVSLSGSYSRTSELNNTIANQQKQLQDLESKASELQAKIGGIKTPEFVSETEFMNNATKRRTFSPL
jgi:cell division protein FtsB